MDVRMPDGTIIRGVPEGYSKAQVMAKYQKMSKAPAAPTGPKQTMADIRAEAAAKGVRPEDIPISATPYPQGSPIQPMWDFLGELGASSKQAQDAIINGMTLGLGRHASALGRSLAPGGGTYREQLGNIDQEREAWSESVPGAAPTLEAMGAFAGPGAAARFGKGLPGLLKMMGLGAAEGAVYGGAAVTGEESDLEDTAIGATAGGLLGGLLPLAVVGGAKGTRAVGRWAGPKMLNPEGRGALNRIGQALTGQPNRVAYDLNRAEQTLADQMSRTGQTPSSLAGELTRIGRGATVADAMGPSGAPLVSQVAAEAPAAAATARTGILGRAAGAADDFTRNIESATGVRVRDARELPTLLKNDLSETARKDFGALEGETIPITKEMRNMFKSDAAQELVSEAKRIAQLNEDTETLKALNALTARRKAPGVDELVDPIPVIDEGVAAEEAAAEAATELSVRAADRVRKRIGDILNSPKYTNELTGKPTGLGRALIQFKKKFTDILTDQKPQYGEALQNYAGRAEIIEMANAGDNFLSMTPETIKNTLEGASAAGKEAFKSRATAAIANKARQAGEGSRSLYGFLESANMRDKAKMVFGEKKADKIIQAVKRADTMRGTEEAVEQGLTRGGRRSTSEITQGAISPEQGYTPHAYTPHGAVVGKLYEGINALKARGRYSPESLDTMWNMLTRPEQAGGVLQQLASPARGPAARQATEDLFRRRIGQASGVASAAVPGMFGQLMRR